MNKIKANDIGLSEELFERIGMFCVGCAFDNHSTGQIPLEDDEKTCCPIAYDIQSKISCPFFKYGNGSRRQYRKYLDSVMYNEDESKEINELMMNFRGLLARGNTIEESLQYCIKRYRNIRKKIEKREKQ